MAASLLAFCGFNDIQSADEITSPSQLSEPAGSKAVLKASGEGALLTPQSL